MTAGRARFRTVVFDCDSTLAAIEGIDELAEANGRAVAELTAAAMRGEMRLEDVYRRRLEIVRPSRSRLAALGRRYVETLVPDAREVVDALREAGIVVRVVSGGLRPAVVALARELGLDAAAVAAVDVSFDEAGEYAGFDPASPLARAGGKRDVLRAWTAELPGPILMVGDGATDLEARPPADRFVAFAGFVERAEVVAAADHVIRERTLAPLLPIALGSGVAAAAAAAPERGDNREH